MSINIGPPSVEELRPRIAVIGVGGAGGNAVANMIQAEIEGVDFIVANTDAQALNNSVAEHRIQLGPDITRGLGAGSRPEVGRAAAEETVEEIERALDGCNMVFLAAGMATWKGEEGRRPPESAVLLVPVALESSVRSGPNATVDIRSPSSSEAAPPYKLNRGSSVAIKSPTCGTNSMTPSDFSASATRSVILVARTISDVPR